MRTEQSSIAIDFSESAFCEAVGKLEINPEEATIWVPAIMIATAYVVQKKFNCHVIAIPNVLARNSFCWGVADKQGHLYFSEGLP